MCHVEQREKLEVFKCQYISKELLHYHNGFVVCHFCLATEVEMELWSLAFEHSSLQPWRTWVNVEILHHSM